MTVREPSDLEMAIIERYSLGLVGFGPLTQDEARIEASYIAYCFDSEAEHAAYVAAGNRSVCDKCGERAVREETVATYGGGLPGSEYSVMTVCGACWHKEL